jgi:hypothetical protein
MAAVINRELDRIIVRLPQGMRDELASLAETNRRSMTAETVDAIRAHLQGPDRIRALVRQILAEERTP